MINGSDPLAALRPLHLPDAVSWWPLAPGWWLVAALLLIAGGGLWWWRRRSALRRAALSELQRLEQRIEQGQLDDRQLAAELNLLLRRVALAHFPRRQVAALCGEAWLQFLDSQAGKKTFSRGPGQALATAPYMADGQIDRPALLALARRWIRHSHRRQR